MFFKDSSLSLHQSHKRDDDFCAGGEPQGAEDPDPDEHAGSVCTHRQRDHSGESHGVTHLKQSERFSSPYASMTLSVSKINDMFTLRKNMFSS